MPKLVYRYNVKRIARHTGISAPHVYNIIRGVRAVTWPNAEILEAVTGISASWWMRAKQKEVKNTLTDPATWVVADRHKKEVA